MMSNPIAHDLPCSLTSGMLSPQIVMSTLAEAVALRGARERLRYRWFGFVLHPECIGADGLEPRGFPPVVDIGEAGAPGAKLGRWRGDVYAGVARALPVVERWARIGTGGHGAVDGRARGLAHLVEKRRLDRFFAHQQHELELGAVHDVGRDCLAGAVDGPDGRQADGDGEAVEVGVGVVQAEARPAVLEHAEHEPSPALDMERAVEEGAALERFALARCGGHARRRRRAGNTRPRRRFAGAHHRT